MPVIMRQQSLAAGASDSNILAGSTFELARGNVFLSIGVTADVTGSFITIFSGSDIVLEESPPPLKATYPIIPDEMFFNDIATLADRIVVAARNPTAGAIVHRVVVQITNL